VCARDQDAERGRRRIVADIEATQMLDICDAQKGIKGEQVTRIPERSAA
jgi:hypothetical protein